MLFAHVGKRQMQHLVRHRPVIGQGRGRSAPPNPHANQASFILGAMDFIAVVLGGDFNPNLIHRELSVHIADGPCASRDPIEQLGACRRELISSDAHADDARAAANDLGTAIGRRHFPHRRRRWRVVQRKMSAAAATCDREKRRREPGVPIAHGKCTDDR